MSKLLEFIKLIPNAIENADKIVEGIITNTKLKNGNLPEDQQEEIIRRRVICAGCPFMSRNAEKLGIYNGKRTEEFCTACSCEIDFKTACLTCSCGLEAHNRRNPKNQLPLKWETYLKPTVVNKEQDDK